MPNKIAKDYDGSTYALTLAERKANNGEANLRDVDYDTKKQISVYEIDSQKFTVEDFLESILNNNLLVNALTGNTNNLIKRIRTYCSTGGGTGRRDYPWI